MPRDAASHVDVPDPLMEVPHTGMASGRRSVHPFGLGALVRFPQDGDIEHREDEPLLVAQRDPGARLDPPRELAVHVEGHRDGPELTAGQPHRFENVFVRLPNHESVEGREPAVHHQLDVAELPLRECHRRHLERLSLQLLGFLLVDEERLQGHPGPGRYDGHAFSR